MLILQILNEICCCCVDDLWRKAFATNFYVFFKRRMAREKFLVRNKLLSPGVGICERSFLKDFFPSCLFRSSSVGKLVVYFLHRHAFSATFSRPLPGPRERKWSRKQNFVHEAKFVGWSMGVGRGVRGVLVGGIAERIIRGTINRKQIYLQR